MTFPFNSSKTNTVILIIFLVFWVYTEVTEDVEREHFQQTVLDFMVTIEHDRLLYRVQQLELIDKTCE